jgi:hypothetical protein
VANSSIHEVVINEACLATFRRELTKRHSRGTQRQTISKATTTEKRSQRRWDVCAWPSGQTTGRARQRGAAEIPSRRIGSGRGFRYLKTREQQARKSQRWHALHYLLDRMLHIKGERPSTMENCKLDIEVGEFPCSSHRLQMLMSVKKGQSWNRAIL